MRRWKICLATAVMAPVAMSPALAQSVVTDPGRGRDIAESLCSTCHIVDASPGNVAKSDISSFYSIANKPDQSQERLAGAIIFPHPAMPKVSFTNSELRDVISYIMSLRTPEPASK
jgi:mono/diheme cytochrome c family protein